MNKIAFAGLLLGVTVGVPTAAFAQNCPPGSWLCADITIGTTPPPVYVQPPPVVVVQPPPPPRVIVIPPPPPRVILQPAPPMVVYQPRPVAYQLPQPQPTLIQPPTDARNRAYVGIQAQLAGALFGTGPGVGGTGAIGGLGAGLRARNASGRLGLELSFNVVAGRDYNGDSRLEVPITLGGMVYFNPNNRFQVYGTAGLGLSVARVTYDANNRNAHGGLERATYTYLGGYAGIGGEIQLSRAFSLFLDIRGFVRGRIDEGVGINPEFARTTVTGSTQTTNASMGAAAQFGGVVYF